MNTITQEMAKSFFDSLPKSEMLAYAKNIQNLILSGDESIVAKKNDGTLVTEADTRLEQMIVDCFKASPLKELCSIKGEEGTANTVKKNTWTLIIDPIDGSSSLVKGTDTWGVMVGFTNPEGILKYSWNLISSGEIFQTGPENISIQKPTLENQKNFRIDFYDYKSGQEGLFKNELEKAGRTGFELTSYPAAVTAGWKLYTGDLSALVWVRGENEKKTFPDYDLLFLAPIQELGYSTRIGKMKTGENVIIVVAPTNEDADSLYSIALSIFTEKTITNLFKLNNSLEI